MVTLKIQYVNIAYTDAKHWIKRKLASAWYKQNNVLQKFTVKSDMVHNIVVNLTTFPAES